MILDTIAAQLSVPAEAVTPGALLVQDLAADLVTLTNLALALEEAFNIEIPDEEWIEVATVGEVVDCVFERLGPDGSPPRGVA